MKKETYNGWSNYETWLCKLWIDESIHDTLIDIALDHSDIKIIMDEIEQWIDEYMPDIDNSIYSDLLTSAIKEINIREIAHALLEESFTPHGSYTVSNSGGYLVEISNCGEAARMKDAYGSDDPEISEWFEIEYIENEDNDDRVPVIDPDGYNIPLNMVMRI